MKTLLLWGLIFGATAAWGDEIRPLFRGARAQAMGNAFTALADDEGALFYNPAGLAGIRKFQLNLATIDAEVSNDLVTLYPQVAEIAKSVSAETANELIGRNLYARARGSASLVVPGFGVAAIYDRQIGIRFKNKVLPEGSLGSLTTYGTQFGFGVPIARLRRKKGAELRFGVAFKALWRSGAYQEPNLPQVLTLDYKSMINGFSNFGMGYGVDTGLQLVYPLKKITLMSGLVYKDIGDIAFGSGLESIKGNLVAGVAATYRGGDMTATLGLDYSNILDSIDWRKKSHMGLELGFPVVSLYAGLSQLYPTYGVSFDFWVMRVMYLSYAEEMASLVNQDPERRHMVQIAFKLNL